MDDPFLVSCFKPLGNLDEKFFGRDEDELSRGWLPLLFDHDETLPVRRNIPRSLPNTSNSIVPCFSAWQPDAGELPAIKETPPLRQRRTVHVLHLGRGYGRHLGCGLDAVLSWNICAGAPRNGMAEIRDCAANSGVPPSPARIVFR